MENKNIIGKKVWLLDGFGRGFRLKDRRLFTIVAVHTIKETGHWCDTYDIKDDNGQVVSVYEYMVIFPLDETIKDKAEQINKFLNDNRAYPTETYNEGEYIVVDIEWGDWKHEHIWCDNLMGYIGYSVADEVVTEENGSDCYSAKHYYLKEE